MGPLSPGCSPGPSTSACPQLISSCLSSPCGLPVPMSNITRHPTAHAKNVGDILNLALPHCPPPVPRPLPLRCPSEQLSNRSTVLGFPDTTVIKAHHVWPGPLTSLQPPPHWCPCIHLPPAHSLHRDPRHQSEASNGSQA